MAYFIFSPSKLPLPWMRKVQSHTQVSVSFYCTCWLVFNLELPIIGKSFRRVILQLHEIGHIAILVITSQLLQRFRSYVLLRESCVSLSCTLMPDQTLLTSVVNTLWTVQCVLIRGMSSFQGYFVHNRDRSILMRGMSSFGGGGDSFIHNTV